MKAPHGQTHRRSASRTPIPGRPRSLPIVEWTESDRLGWTAACVPGERLRRGGAASHLAPVSRADIANRYGLYLDFLQRSGRLDRTKGAATLVTLENVNAFLAELQARVRSVTVWNSIYKLRRAAELIAPATDFAWLAEIEKDIALIMRPRSKADRLVLAERLLEAGLTLSKEAELFCKTPVKRAAAARNGLMITVLALCPIRIKNFAELTIGSSFINISGRWWLHVRSTDTKAHHVEHRPLPDYVTESVNSYMTAHRPILTGSNPDETALWVSSTTRRRMTTKNLGTLISKITLETLGVDVSPHLFRTAGASTAAIYGGQYPNLATALLAQRDPRVNEEHYNRAMSLSAGEEYASITRLYRTQISESRRL